MSHFIYPLCCWWAFKCFHTCSGRHWELDILSTCSVLNWEQGIWWLPTQISISILTSPQEARLCQVYQHLTISKSEASTLGSPKKNCGIVGNCGFCRLTQWWARGKELWHLPTQASVSILLQVARLCQTIKALRMAREKPTLWRGPSEKLGTLDMWTSSFPPLEEAGS